MFPQGRPTMAEIPRIASITPTQPVTPHATRVHKSGDSPDHHEQNHERKHDSVEIEDEEVSVEPVRAQVPDDEHLDISV